MKFSIEKDSGINVIMFHGDLWGGEETYQMQFKIKDEVTALAARGERKFIMDLKKTKRVNSTGIGLLVANQSSIKNVDGELKLCEVTSRARTALVVTGVKQLFDIYETREEAIKAYVGESLSKA